MTTKQTTNEPQALRLSGRCADGAERDGGSLYHAVLPQDNRALCGARPGRRSAGWSSYPGDAVTCPRCLNATRHLIGGRS